MIFVGCFLFHIESISMQKIGLSQIKMIEAKVKSSDEYISLSQGALRVGGVPHEIKKHLREVLRTDKTDYYQSAWGIMPLREAIAKHLSSNHSVLLSSSNILVSHGCMGAISTLLFTLLENGDEVLLPEPTYPAYGNIVSVAGGKSVFVSCMKDEWRLNLDALEAARTSRTKIILFSNPCNPSGVIISKETLELLIIWCEKHGIYLIADEAYDDFIFDEPFHSMTSYVPQSYFVIRVGSYSKSLSMSGWRIGFMVVPEHLSSCTGITQDAILNCPNVIAQYAVLYALEHPEFSKKFHRVVKKNRDAAITQLQPLVKKGIFSFQKPPAGFYLFLRTQESDSFDLCMSILHDAKVGLIPGRAFGPSGTPFVRLCYARTGEVLQEGIGRIRKFFNV